MSNTHNQQNSDTTHFGFQEVKYEAKQKLVGDLFSNVANNYDIMNDAMSLGIHRLWKQFAVMQSRVKTGDIVLDLAAGSADLSIKFAKRVGSDGKVFVTDINPDMLAQGKQRLINAGFIENLEFCLVNAEQLPFQDNYFDCISISLGLRNVTNKEAALKEMQRCLKPGGRLIVLEFSHPKNATFKSIYDTFSFNVIPFLGQLISNDKESYQYLVESIRQHPDQETLKQMMLGAGFDQVRYHNLTGGIVALHTAHIY